MKFAIIILIVLLIILVLIVILLLEDIKELNHQMKETSKDIELLKKEYQYYRNECKTLKSLLDNQEYEQFIENN